MSCSRGPEVRVGVFYTIGGAAALPTWGSAPPALSVATPIFASFRCDFAPEWLWSLYIFTFEGFTGVKKSYSG